MRYFLLFVLLFVFHNIWGQVNCNKWLSTPTIGSAVNIGDLDISGNQITIEATINRNQPYSPGTGNNTEGDVVSKHTDPNDVNYLLRPNHAYITTTNGFFGTPDVCTIQLNKTYHIALVYNGTTLKFYRNGFLLSQVNATGNLFQNNLNTRIGYYDLQVFTTQFLGYINEVRIWNVARTQTELQTYMNTSLPNPTTQVGLKGYYTFDNLLNKQGNATFNGTINGGAVINATNPNCNFIADSCAIIPTTPCNNWLSTPTLGSAVNVGDLDISGNQITIEATINRTAPFSGGNLFAGDIVSKHTGPLDVNYLLRPNSAEITTSNGYFITPTICGIELNKTYHVAMIYNGTTLKFYRNGFLMSQVNATGNLFQNNFNTRIGYYDLAIFNTQFLGYINEVRIWDVARTQTELQTYMNTSLPTPTTLVGLKGYYTFDNLLNKQGNAAFNGTLNGGATINATNPNCNFVGDSCFVAACATKEDFSISFDPCSPYSVSLLTTATVGSYTNIKWDMGNSTVLNGMANPTYNYNSAGNYTIKMILEKPNCNDTVTKVVTLNITNENIISTNDTTICLGASKVLIGLPSDKFCWTPTTYLTNSNTSTPTATPLVTTKYFYTAEKEGTNLVINGNFTNGNTGFTSDYFSVNPNTGPAQYFIGTNPISWNGNSGPCVDHTTGNGNMMMVNGSPNINAKIWAQSINVIPNTNYKFSLWIQSISPISPAILNFSINDLPIGADFAATSINCEWRKHTINWNSGSNTIANIAIKNRNTAFNGNDFTLDDISFAPTSIIRDSVTLNVVNCNPIIINDYTPILSLDPCKNILNVGNSAAYNVGDTVLLIQMKGAIIDSTNTAAFGTITDYKSAGNYEYNYVKSKTGNSIELKNKILRTYEIPNGKVQLIRVPYYQNYTTTSSLSCLPWDGTIGGVLVFNVANTLTLNNDIDVSGKGFRGGKMKNSNFNGFTCNVTDYFYQDNTRFAAGKGEGIAVVSSSKNSGKGPLANGGGGGMDTNSGGGGGANGNIGGRGGNELNICPNYLTSQNWGFPGKSLNYSITNNKIFLGGGGGAGHCNNQYEAPNLVADFNGGNGGGLVIIKSDNLITNGFVIKSNGDSAFQLNNTGFISHDGMGGGGAGGSILLDIINYSSPTSLKGIGGQGGNMIASPTGGLVGPGGGGGGGLIWVKQPSLPLNININATGGLNGVIIQNANNPYGAAPGLTGQTLFNLNLPITSIPFKPNIDSVKINALSTSCQAFNFNGLGFTNTNPIASWQWYFGDNTTGTGQNVSHTYTTTNTFTVKLAVTDINGCKDSITRNVTTLCPTEIIINDYIPVLSLDPCKNILNVGNAAAYNVGDTVLLIQMKGAVIDSTNTAAFGTITDYKSAGNYEYNYVKSKTGNQIELKNKILRTYEIPNGKVQLIRVPYYQNYATTSTLTCLPWNGTIGGVLVFNVANTLTLNNDIDVSGKGFKGGIYEQKPSACGETSFFYNQTSTKGAFKGENISELSTNLLKGRGKSSNGGGGGNNHNSGGGGGANFGQGGNGGKEYNLGGSFVQQDNGGIGGIPLIYSNASNKIFLGGGGGAGDINGVLGGFKGGNGGGLVFISSNNVVITGNNSILNSGEKAFDCLTNDCWESGSGGGSGGTVLLDVNNISGSLNINTSGGAGGSLSNPNPAGYCAPGGGGGGGLLWLKSSTLNTNINYMSQGGAKGVFVALNQTGGSTDGAIGGTLSNLITPITTIPFKPNIDSVKINAANTTCSNYNFNGLGYTNTNPITSWQWYFGDGATATGQNVSHNYTTTNTFTVKLVITDINGCKDSITRNITTNSIVVDAGIDKTFCGAQTGVSLTGISASAGTSTYAWTSVPATTITNASSLTPSANVNTTTTFYITVTSSLGCSGIDSIKVIINPVPIVQTLNDVAICKGTSLQLTTTLGLNTYQWSNGIYVSDSTIANPIFTDTISRTLIVTGSNGLCVAKDTINISIKPLPIVKTIKDTLICSTQNISLTTIGAATYSWTPATFLSSTSSPSPTYLGTGTTNTSTTYFVTGTAANGCNAKDTLVVNMNVPNSFTDPPNKSFCKNESVQLNGNNGNTVTYNWQPPTAIDNQNIINPVVNPALSTAYTVNITDPVCNYSKIFTVIVTVNPLPTITLSKSNDISCTNLLTKLNANGGVTYTWNTSPTLSNINIQNPNANPTANTTYTVTGTDINGCKNNNKISVFVSLGKNIFDLPNTFTPNADTKNDCFGAINWGNAQEVFFIIYNRWGEKVFETKNINTCWNGEFKGKPALEGNYVYYIRAKTACGDVVKKGNVLLIR